METILSSLNALVEKLGGDTSDNKLIVDALNDISEKFGGDADNKMIVDALNNIVENYSGGGSIDIEFRTITVTNNHSENSTVRLYCTGKIANGSVRYSNLGFPAKNGETKSFEIVSPSTAMSKYLSQEILVAADFQPTITSAELGDLPVTDLGIAATTKYNLYFIKIPVTTYKEFSITVS